MSYPTSNHIARELEDFWQESNAQWQLWQSEASIDLRMLTGQQRGGYGYGGYGGYGGSGNNNANLIVINKMLRIHNMIGGYQRDSRLATQYSPADNDIDQGESATQMTTVMDWVMRKDQTYEKISDSFDGAISCGLNLMHTYMDFREDPENGELRTERLPYNSFIMDNFWTKPDLSDCNRVWTRKYLNVNELKSLVAPKVFKELPKFGKGYAYQDGRFPYMSQNRNQSYTDLVAYDEYWTKDYKTGRKLLDTRTGEVAPWYGTREQFQMLRRINPNVQMIKAQVPTIKLHVLVNNNCVYEEKTPWGLDRLPFVPFLCYFYPEVQEYSFRYQGIIRAMRDMQNQTNIRTTKLFDVLDAQVQSGIIVKEDALVNPEDAFLQGPGKVFFMKNSANLATDFSQLPPPPVAPGWMELIASLQKEMMDIVGPEELFAQNLGNKEMSGVLMKLKMGAGLTGLRNIFDRLNQSQMILGEIMLDLVMNNFSSGKVQAIIGKEPSQLIQEAMSPEHQLKGISRSFTRYNVVVEEAELTTTQRQLQFLQAFQLKQAGIPVSTKYLLEKSSLQGKKDLIDSIMQEEQQQRQMQQQMAQAELQQSQVLSRSLEAKAQSDFASAIASRSRAVGEESLAKERSAKAVYDRSKAALDNVKTLSEIEELDENRMIRLMDYVAQLQERQQALALEDQENSAQIASDVAAPVEAANMQSQVGV